LLEVLLSLYQVPSRGSVSKEGPAQSNASAKLLLHLPPLAPHSLVILIVTHHCFTRLCKARVIIYKHQHK